MFIESSFVIERDQQSNVRNSSCVPPLYEWAGYLVYSKCGPLADFGRVFTYVIRD